MSNNLQAQVKVTSVPQVCVVVRDIEAVARSYWEALGIGPWDILTLETPVLFGQKFKGKDSDYGFRVGFAQVGPVQLELIEPTVGQSMYTEFLDQHGEGLQHVMFLADTEVTAQADLRAFAQHGSPLLLEGRFGDGYFAYAASQPTLKTVWEIVKMPTELSAPTISVPADKSTANSAPLKVNAITQIGLVAQNVEEAMGNYVRVMGASPWSVLDAGPDKLKEMMYCGQPTQVRERVGYFNFGNVEFQIVQPLSGANYYSDFMTEHGEGLDHLQFTVTDLNSTIATMNALGFRTLMSGRFLDGGFAYFDTRDRLKCVWKALQPPTTAPSMTNFYG